MAGWDPSPRHSLQPVLATPPKPFSPDTRVTWGPIPRDKALINKFSAPVPEWKPLQPKKAFLCILLCLLSHFILALLMVGRRAGRTRGQVHKTGTFEGGFEIRGGSTSAWLGDRRHYFMAQFCPVCWGPPCSPFPSPGPGLCIMRGKNPPYLTFCLSGRSSSNDSRSHS